VAIQTLYAVRVRREAEERAEKPALLDSCYAYATASPVVRRRWPHLYTGPDAIEAALPAAAQ